MILDQQNVLSDGQAITATAYSTNAIDLGETGTLPWRGGSPIDDIGRGTPAQMLAQVTTAFTGGTSVQAQIVTSDNANLSSHTVLSQSDAIPVATLAAGYQFRIGGIPPGVTGRYLGMRYVVVGTPTAGAVTAAIVMDKQTNPTV